VQSVEATLDVHIVDKLRDASLISLRLLADVHLVKLHLPLVVLVISEEKDSIERDANNIVNQHHPRFRKIHRILKAKPMATRGQER